MQRGDVYFTSVGNNFCFSEHFLPSDFKLSTLIETGRRTLGFSLYKRQVYFAGCRLKFNYNWKPAGT